uniref:Uncharacterized protein n=1 Tax=Oryza sativa subsp. japonica TaxID=39947 RepID=Q6K4D0_ORYSJ|nr:hypothetical protein [Oryza sativa Japonica Group]
MDLPSPSSPLPLSLSPATGGDGGERGRRGSGGGARAELHRLLADGDQAFKQEDGGRRRREAHAAGSTTTTSSTVTAAAFLPRKPKLSSNPYGFTISDDDGTDAFSSRSLMSSDPSGFYKCSSKHHHQQLLLKSKNHHHHRHWQQKTMRRQLQAKFNHG